MLDYGTPHRAPSGTSLARICSTIQQNRLRHASQYLLQVIQRLQLPLKQRTKLHNGGARCSASSETCNSRWCERPSSHSAGMPRQ